MHIIVSTPFIYNTDLYDISQELMFDKRATKGKKKLEERMMKTIILLLAVLAMVGFAAAWDTTEQMQYAYQKTVNDAG